MKFVVPFDVNLFLELVFLNIEIFRILFLDCDVCEVPYLDFCKKCGKLVTLEAFPVPFGIENRAIKTVPKGTLEIKKSNIHGLGLFASKVIDKGVRLGPYEGEITRIESTNGYSWKLKDGRLVRFVL